MPLLRIYRVGFNYFDAMFFHVADSTVQGRSGYAFPSVVPVGEETGYSPEVSLVRGSIIPHVVYAWQFFARTELAPAHGSSAMIYEHAMRFPMLH